VFQFALTILLMAGTLTIQSQFNFLTTKDLGYDEENLLKIQLPPGGPKSISESFRDELQSRPQIVSVSGSRGAFESGYFDNLQTGNKHANAIGAAIDEFFLPTMGIHLSKGENFHSGALNEGILINETLANALGLDDPIGETVSLASARESTKIIGVMKDFNYWPLQADVKPLFYFYQAEPHNELWVRAASGKVSEAIPVIAQAYKKLVDDYPFTYQVIEESNDRNYNQEAGWKQILAYGSAFAIFISGIGLFGFTAVSVVKRTREIGMRKVLGASGSDFIVLFIGDFLPLVFLGVFLSVPVAYLGASKWLQTFANRINLDWWLFVVPAIIAIAIATLTISVYTAISLRTNPVEALRTE
jgi:ABC-type antimicrobial peptide transport system permease subunit